MKTHALALAAALALASLAGKAGATEFYLAGLTEDTVIAVDLTRQIVDDDVHTTWVTFIFRDPKAVAGRPYTNSLMRFSVDCGARTHRVGTTLYFNGEREVFREQTVTGWSDILPESKGELVANALCSNEPRDPEYLVTGSASYLLESVEAYLARNR